MEASRIMNLYQFIQLYHDISSQAAEVLTGEGASREPSVQLPSTDSCQASMWMGRYPELSPHSPCRTLPRQEEQHQPCVQGSLALFRRILSGIFVIFVGLFRRQISGVSGCLC